MTFRANAAKRLTSVFVPGNFKLILIVVALLGVVGSTAWVLRDHYTGKAAKVELKQVKQDNTVFSHAATAANRAETGNTIAKAAITAKESKGLARTQKALDAHPDWAQQPIPADVLVSLRD